MERTFRRVLAVKEEVKEIIESAQQEAEEIRERAEAKLAELCGCSVSLRLWVKVAKDWRRKKGWIHEMNQPFRHPDQ